MYYGLAMNQTKRRLEVDALRGIAIIMMAIFHSMIIVDEIGLVSTPWSGPFWYDIFGYSTRFLFWTVFGLSIVLSKRNYEGQLQRMFKLVGAAALVTLGSAVFFGEDFVRFGILHMLAAALPLVAWTKGRPWGALIGVIFALVLAPYVEPLLYPWLFSRADYIPLFPNIAVIYGAIFVGHFMYVKGVPSPQGLEPLGRVRPLTWLGQHSLKFYLLHIPVLYFSFWAFQKLFF